MFFFRLLFTSCISFCCRLTQDHIIEIEALASTHFGAAEDWEDSDLSSLGSIFSMFSHETINAVNNVVQIFYSSNYSKLTLQSLTCNSFFSSY